MARKFSALFFYSEQNGLFAMELTQLKILNENSVKSTILYAAHMQRK